MSEEEIAAFSDAIDRPAAEVIEARPLPDLSAWNLRREKYLKEAVARHDREISARTSAAFHRQRLIDERRRLKERIEYINQVLRETR